VKLYVTYAEFAALLKLSAECFDSLFWKDEFERAAVMAHNDRRWVEGVARILGTTPEDLMSKVPPGSPPVEVMVWKMPYPHERWGDGRNP
jgi:hypothetical protein